MIKNITFKNKKRDEKIINSRHQIVHHNIFWMIFKHSFLIRRLYTCSQINQYQFNSGTKEYKHCQKCKALIYPDWKFCQCICIADSVMYIMFVFAVRRRFKQTLESSMIKEKIAFKNVSQSLENWNKSIYLCAKIIWLVRSRRKRNFDFVLARRIIYPPM